MTFVTKDPDDSRFLDGFESEGTPPAKVPQKWILEGSEFDSNDDSAMARSKQGLDQVAQAARGPMQS